MGRDVSRERYTSDVERKLRNLRAREGWLWPSCSRGVSILYSEHLESEEDYRNQSMFASAAVREPLADWWEGAALHVMQSDV